MKNIAFIGNSESPQKLLELFKKFTPARSGDWGSLHGVDNYLDADYFGVIDYIPNEIKNQIDETKCVFLGGHPESMQSWHDMSNYKGIRMYDCINEFGFGEWWLNYDYDYLKNLQPPTKTKNLGCIMSNADSQNYHKLRLNWLQRFTDKPNLDFDLHGRLVPRTENMKKYYKGECGSMDARGSASSGGNDHMSGKEDVYSNHKYMIEFDAVGENYFSERVFDCLLMWCMPIYWGGKNLHKYLPKESFKYLNIEGAGEDVLAIVNSDLYEKALPYIKKAREILLDELQIWARIHKAIFGGCK